MEDHLEEPTLEETLQGTLSHALRTLGGLPSRGYLKNDALRPLLPSLWVDHVRSPVLTGTESSADSVK